MKATAGIEEGGDGGRCAGPQCIDGSSSVDLSRLTGRLRAGCPFRRHRSVTRVAARMKKPAGRLARAGGRRHLGPTGAGVA
ncbi:hypothetical protein C7S14_1754 [Burkholderia cepacia]|nr:hypothetical protein C7S14_1754 [Burkholderia cepacia]